MGIKIHKMTAVFTACCALLCCGCSEIKEINDMAVVSGFSVDFTDGCYRVTAEIVNKNEEGSPAENRKLIHAQGTTLSDAVANCNFLDSRQLYTSHAKAIVVGQSLAESEGIQPVLDYVMRNYKTRLATDLFISELPTAEAVAALSSPSSGLIYYDLEEMAKTDALYGACIPAKVYQVFDTLSGGRLALTVPIVGEQEDQPLLTGLAVFRGDKMAGRLSQEETLYLMLLQDHVTKAHLTLPDRKTGLDIVNVRRTFSQEQQGARQVLSVALTLTCSLSQSSMPADQTDIERLASEAAESVETECGKLILRAQKWNCDLFGFSEAFRPESGQQNGQLPNFQEIPVRVSCTVILKEGEIHR